MDNVNLALRLHKQGFDCCLSVAAAFKEYLSEDKKRRCKEHCVSLPGCPRTQCGAITGGIAVLKNLSPDSARNLQIPKLINNFQNEFIAKHKTLNCSELLGGEINDPYIERNESSCGNYITDAVKLLNSILKRPME